MTNTPADQGLTTTIEPAPLTPFRRWYRTVVQVLLALALAVPSAAALFDLSAPTSAKISATMGALAIIVSAIHNAINARQAATP